MLPLLATLISISASEVTPHFSQSATSTRSSQPVALVMGSSTSAHVLAVYTTTPPKIDGKLDDPVWQTAQASTVFTQKFPSEGDAPAEKTTLRILYDHTALYVSFDCEQLRAPIIGRLTRRGRQVESDWVSIDFGTRRDGKSAFEFMVNVSGVLSDGLRFNDTDYSGDWDEIWDARTEVTERGWSAEFYIPLRILRFDTLPLQSWDFEARRYISALQETDEWALIPRNAGGEVSHYGKLDGLVGLESTARLELRPFVLGRIRRRDAVEGQLASGTDASGSAGLDLKWHPNQALTIDASFNPDFAQVEADQLVLNLTTFETYYPEQRSFFLEGIDTFATPMQLLYTRRIGRVPAAPTLRSDPTLNEQLVDVPLPSTIYGAAKVTGRFADRWMIGAIEAVTGRNDVQVQLADRSRPRRLVDPLTSYSFLRLRRDLGDNADLGISTAITARAEPVDDYPLAGGSHSPSTELCPNGITAPRASRCFNNAYVGAMDWRWRWGGGDWVTGGQAAASMLDRGPPRSVRDGTLIHPGDIGGGVVAYLNKEGGEHWVGDVNAEYNNRKLDLNDLGFDRRANNWRWRTDIEYRELKPWWIFRESRARFEYFGRTNLDGLDIGSGYQLNVSGKLTNHWWFFSELHFRPRWFDDREVGDGTALEHAGLIGYELEMKSDPTRVVSFVFETQTQLLFNGLSFYGIGGVLFRVLPQLDLELLPTARYATGEPRYIGTGATPGKYLFGVLRGTALGATLRATYTFTPRLTLQLYTQLFLASEHYSELTAFQSDPNGARSVVHLSDLRSANEAPATNPDLEEGVVNVNLIVRWEFQLGSTLFLVYTRSQVPSIALTPGEQGMLTLHAIGRAPSADAVLLKLSYWF